MTKRYFYTDPLAAAWMTRHHGLRVGLLEPAYAKIDPATVGETHMIGADMFIDMLYLDLLKWVMEDNLDWKFFVHPDSLHLLEPQDRDFLEIKDQDYYLGSYITSVSHKHSKALGLPLDHSYRETDFKIIQREGKPFHWPEQEAP